MADAVGTTTAMAPMAVIVQIRWTAFVADIMEAP
jgi:hypothetical protein